MSTHAFAISRSVTAVDSRDIDVAIAERNVRAILIAGDHIGSPGRPTPGATDSLDIIERDLRSRFRSSDVAIARLGARPTKQLVTDAFTAMQAIVRPGELFVVMFAGHGMPPSDARPAHAWSLTGDEAFTDLDLARALLEFPAEVDTVVISNCCYGEGLFAVECLAGRRVGPQPWNIPMICISAAGKRNLVELTRMANLARATVGAAAARQSYRQLAASFARTAVAGATFHVDARPISRMDDRVLSSDLGRQEGDIVGQTARVLSRP
jgi:hypothetical protein